MKCIKDTALNAVSRVKDEIAAKLVASDPIRYKYTAKSVWRAATRKKGE